MIERQVEFDGSMHSADAVQRAAYRLSDRMACDMTAANGMIRCTVHIDADASGDADVLLAELRNTVLDETLRERIRDETKEVRHLILALAFSNTGLVDEDSAA